MKKSFLKLIVLATTGFASEFNQTVFETNSAQVLAIFLPGGSSQLAGNLTNFADINRLSENSYPNSFTVTENGFWKEAGGSDMEEMLASKQLTVVRTIFRGEESNTRSHGIQIVQNQTGSLNAEKSGFFADILNILNQNSAISESVVLPALSFTGGTPIIYHKGDLNLPSYLNFSTIDSNLDNPYSMRKNGYLEDGEDEMLQSLADRRNLETENALFEKASSNFVIKRELATFVDDIAEKEVSTSFPNTIYGNSIKSALKMMVHNSNSKLGFIEFGGWDDHSGAVNNYKSRMYQLFEALHSGVEYLKSERNRKISIWVFTEFGRNVNLNDSLGWDHGNIFNLFVLGNNPTYLKMGKIVGETEIFKPELSGNRVYMKPIENSEKFEPFSIASTIEKIFGIENPHLLTGEIAIKSILK
jgi:uncharacterized protein (DUF1501 family)